MKFLEGSSVIALGVMAVNFARKSFYRTYKEKKLIKSLWAQDMTLSCLKEKAMNGETLPNLVIIPGKLAATGPKVKAITTRI
jgi:hypothetical protein